jgi:hypothetical protein
LTQVQGVLVEQCSASEQEKLALHAQWDNEKEELQQSKEQLIAENLELKELVIRERRFVTIIEVKDEE